VKDTLGAVGAHLENGSAFAIVVAAPTTRCSVERSVHGEKIRIRIRTVGAAAETVDDSFRARGIDFENRSFAARTARKGYAEKLAVHRNEARARIISVGSA
jgi:hypothetical protein